MDIRLTVPNNIVEFLTFLFILTLIIVLKHFILKDRKSLGEMENAMYKILIVEDDYTIAELLRKSLLN